MLTANMKEEQAKSRIADLTEKLKAMANDKKELEMEFVAIKTNFL